ncbi:MAG: isoprenylcysteine carboxylmethyltransferase family protein [Alphaproteobacteria bacterium]|nr:isoprenylcysteine carboxylmethyltransferase family protein [Alphaproteobacteria bacterium]
MPKKIKTDRLSTQGWINKHRKTFLLVNTLVFLGFWFFTNPLIPFSYQLKDLLEGFGSLLLIAGVLGRMYSSLTIASHKDQQVAKTEIYSVVRHPLYFFSFLIAIGIGLLTGRMELLLYIIVFFLACFYPMILNEERFLEGKFGKEYTDYKKQVPMLIPNFSKWKARERIEINMRLVTRTILDGSLFLLIIPLIEIVNYVKDLI